ncbi:MAG TPA: hypothetical protein VFN10_24260 [Thermoanaerobaculia bacterium]|nr:hypothetical protein [Thermoanaerobaculia bacterium]
MSEPPRTDGDWRGDFASAEDELFERMAALTPAQRLQWLEQALTFAYRAGALKEKEAAGWPPLDSQP